MGEGRGPGNMQALSLIKARRCRPADKVWPHLALIRFQLPPAWPALAQPSRQRTTRPVHCTWGTWGHPPQPNSALHAQTPDRCLCSASKYHGPGKLLTAHFCLALALLSFLGIPSSMTALTLEICKTVWPQIQVCFPA